MVAYLKKRRVNRENSSFLSFPVGSMILLGGLVMVFTALQEQQVVGRYSAEFGLYEQTLTLKKNRHFAYHYHGCNQAAGSLNGLWKLSADTLKLEINRRQRNTPLSEKYLVVDDALLVLPDKRTIFYAENN